MGTRPGVRASSETSITIDFRFRGVRCREKLKLRPTPANLAFARKLKARIEHEIAVGTFDYAVHFPASPRARSLAKTPALAVTVGELMSEWLQRARPELEPETYRDYAEYVKNTWAEKFGPLTLSAFSRDLVEDWIASQTTSRKRILNLLTPLRQSMRYAVAQKLIPADPLLNLRVQRPRANSEDTVDPFTPAEIAAVVQKLHPSVANLAEFWVWAGLREGELFGLTWSDVDFDRGVLRVSRAVRETRTKATKTARGTRTIRLLAPALEALRRQKLQTRLLGQLVFVNLETRPRAGGRWVDPKPGPWTEKKLRQVWEAACAAAGVRYRPPKQMRHTFASWTLSAGESVQWVSAVMGHSNSAITQRVYARLIPDAFPDAGTRTIAAIRGTRA